MTMNFSGLPTCINLLIVNLCMWQRDRGVLYAQVWILACNTD
jgi:hypothetical protein